MLSNWQALRRGESAQDRRRQLAAAYEAFASDPELAADPELLAHFAQLSGLRPVVLASWLRSQQGRLDPNRAPDQLAMDEAQLDAFRQSHPIAKVLPVVQRLLFDEAVDSGLIVAVGDAAGRLLWVEGDHGLRERAEEMGFRAGMDWSERAVGTSAPGSALAVDHAIQVIGAEHYNRFVHQWSCTAAPVHDPLTGAPIGVVDVTGGDYAASPHLLPLLEATIAAVESELKFESFRHAVEQTRSARHQIPIHAATTADRPTAVPRLVLLGREPAVLEGPEGALPVGGRHAEILLALAAAPNGLSAGALAEQVYGSAGSEATLRPELVRLRKWIEQHGLALELSSRPYQLRGELRVDAIEVLGALGRGAHRLALAAYDGPVLPASESPVAEDLRAEVSATLREAMLQSAAADQLFEYAQNWALDDEEIWATLLQVLPPQSPKRARVVARLAHLQR